MLEVFSVGGESNWALVGGQAVTRVVILRGDSVFRREIFLIFRGIKIVKQEGGVMAGQYFSEPARDAGVISTKIYLFSPQWVTVDRFSAIFSSPTIPDGAGMARMAV